MGTLEGWPEGHSGPDEGDPAGQPPKLYPIPPNAPIEVGPASTGDRHVLLVDRDNCTLYEIFDAHPNGAAAGGPAAPNGGVLSAWGGAAAGAGRAAWP